MPEFDGPWKEAITALFCWLLRLYRPREAEQMNWQREAESLETEMQKLLPASQTGVKRIDKLIKVWRLNGESRYFHVEVQCWLDKTFEHRVYNNTAELFCGDPVDSLIVLGDNDPQWLPSGYAWERSCSRKTFAFEPLKVLHWRGREEELFTSDNPFALFLLAHLQVWATEGDDKARAESKLRLLLRCCALKMTAAEEVDRPVLLRLIDWLLPLPKERNDPIWQQVEQFREGETMPFVSWFEEQIEIRSEKRAEKLVEERAEKLAEKLAEERGDLREIKALQKGIAGMLKLKFAAEGEALAVEVEKQTDLEWLRRFFDAIDPANAVDELRAMLP